MKRFGMETVVAINLFPEIHVNHRGKNFCKVYNVKKGGMPVSAKVARHDWTGEWSGADRCKHKSRFTSLYEIRIFHQWRKDRIPLQHKFTVRRIGLIWKAKSQLKQTRNWVLMRCRFVWQNTQKFIGWRNKKAVPKLHHYDPLIWICCRRRFYHSLGEISRMPGLPNIPAAETMILMPMGKSPDSVKIHHSLKWLLQLFGTLVHEIFFCSGSCLLFTPVQVPKNAAMNTETQKLAAASTGTAFR